MEPGASKWRRERPESCDDSSKVGDLKKPISLGHPGTLKKGKTPPVAVTSPITHTAQSALRVSGEPAVELGTRGQGPAPRRSASGRERALTVVREFALLLPLSLLSACGTKIPERVSG